MQTQKVIEYIVGWLKNYAIQAGMKGYVVGVSGGIDSAVVSTLVAMTGLQVLLIEMPIRQKQDHVDRAWDHIKDLKARFKNVEAMSVDLNKSFNQLSETFDSTNTQNSNKNLALANVRSRLRMITLYYHGQLNGLLVAGTGNKVEDQGVGFFTKYGDGGVDVSPIGDLYKTEVYSVAEQLNVIKSIRDAQPTDGLWDTDASDEQQIGATYPELEKIQKEYGVRTVDSYSGRDREVYLIFDRMHRAALHKINPIPICTIPGSFYKNCL
jgi:NAD+ synthase